MRMFTNDLDLGFARVRVTVNNKPAGFEVKKNSRDAYWVNDDMEVHPVGCVDIIVDVLPYQVGDMICVEFDRGALVCDGGGESRMNLVGEISSYTVAMGAPDWDENETACGKNWPEDMHPTRCLLPYENRGYTSRGFEFQIVDAVKAYSDRFCRTNIVITVAWESSSKAYAWDLVSFLTS